MDKTFVERPQNALDQSYRISFVSLVKNKVIVLSRYFYDAKSEKKSRKSTNKKNLALVIF